MNIVLLEPEIPQNTGNIGRTCVATGAVLHLIRPMGFTISEKTIRRAGLDYWSELEYYIYDDFEHFYKKNENISLFLASTKATQLYSKVSFTKDSYIMFGKESAGIPSSLRERFKNSCIRVPMKENNRSLNLANSVAIVLYEALRQNNFIDLI